MNCAEFETLVLDLARDVATPTFRRETALAHAQVCGRCAGRLAEEQALTSALQELAQAAEDEQAPWTVEAGLRRSLVAQRQPSVPRAGSRRYWLPAAVAAGVLVAALGYRLTYPTATGEHAMLRTPPPEVAANPPAMPGDPPAPIAAERAPTPVARAESGVRRAAFYPLFYGDDLSTVESGVIVRVRLSRSALASLGMPVTEERRAERIEAELLVSEDGLARAIHFLENVPE
jgi:hypothetical protein